MKKIQHTIQRDGRYHVKIRVPKELSTLYGGRVMLQKSLKTADPQAAERGVRQFLAVMDAQRETIQADAAWRTLARYLPPEQKAMLEAAGGLVGLLKQFEAGQTGLTFMAAGAPSTASLTEIDTTAGGAPLKVFVKEVNREETQVHVAEHRAAAETIQAQTNAKARVLRALGEDVESGEVFTLTDLLTDWQDTVAPHTAENARTIVRRFTELNGDIELVNLTGVHLREFTDAIKFLPRNQNGKRLHMTIQELSKIRGETISYSTQRKYFDILKGLMNFAIGRRYLTTDPWAGMKLIKPKTKYATAAPRRAFNGAEVSQILDYLENSNLPQYGDSTIDRWAPFLAAYQGLRLQEICQLRASDFKKIDGVYCLSVTDAGDGQRVKNRNSVRTIPVHPALRGLKDVIGDGDGPAFNQWGRLSKRCEELHQDGRGRVSAAYGNRFATLLRGKIGIPDKEAVFHSFRHRWQDACDNAGIPDSHRRALAGRASVDTVEDSYGSGVAVKVLLESLSKVDPR